MNAKDLEFCVCWETPRARLSNCLKEVTQAAQQNQPRGRRCVAQELIRCTVNQQRSEGVKRNLEETDPGTRSGEKIKLRTVEEGFNLVEGKCPVLEVRFSKPGRPSWGVVRRL